jgi:hypothetical protein
VKLGIENRKQMIAAAVLGVFLLLVLVYQFMPSSSTIASTTSSTATSPLETVTKKLHSAPRHGTESASTKKTRPPQSLDPTLHLAELASAEQIKYEGSGRNIFVSEPDAVIPTPLAPGVVTSNDPKMYQAPSVAAPPPIPLKFFGFASKKGEPKKIFLSKGEDVFIAGEGEIVDRRYKVVRISPTSVEIQDVVGSGPPQNIPLTQG